MKTLTIGALEEIIKRTKDQKLKTQALVELSNRLGLIKNQIKGVK